MSYESEELKVVLEGFALTSSDIKAVGIYTVAGQVYASIAKGFDGRETLGAVTQVM